MDKFKLATIIVSSITVLLILVLLVITESIGFSVRRVVGLEDVDYVNASLTIRFTSPIKTNISVVEDGVETNKELQDLIRVNPQTPLGLTVLGQNIIVSFRDPLEFNSEYTLQISKDLENIYGQKLGKDQSFTFAVPNAKYSFIQSGLGQVGDKLMEKELGKDEVEIFSVMEIKKYVKNKDYYAIVERKEDQTEDIIILNRQNNSRAGLNLQSSHIIDMQIDRNINTLYYMAYPIQYVQDIAVPLDSAKLYEYIIDTRETRVIDLPEAIQQAGRINLIPGSQTILVRDDQNSEYYVLDINDFNNYTSVGGPYMQFGGINRADNSLIFANFDSAIGSPDRTFFSIFTSERETVDRLKDVARFRIDPAFIPFANSVIYAEQYRSEEGTKGLFRISIFDLETGAVRVLINEGGLSTEFPVVSANGQVVSVEQYTSDAIRDFENQRLFPIANKPKKAEIIIIDLETGEIIERGIEGIEVQWD